jgi:hypothetical protein
MATFPHVLISNTGAIGGALKFPIRQDSWRVWTDPAEVFTGLDGSTSIAIGAQTGKLRWSFTGLVQKVGASTYVSLDGAGQTVFQWAASTTVAQRLLKFQDIYGLLATTGYDVVWMSAYKPVPLTGGINLNGEWFEIPVELWQA